MTPTRQRGSLEPAGHPAPNTFNEALHLTSIGDETLVLGSGHGRAVLSGLIALPSPEARRLRFSYDPPPGVVRRVGDSPSHQLLVQAQPGARGRETSIVMRSPPGWEVAGASGPQAVASRGGERVRFVLGKDTRVEVQLETTPREAAE